MVDLNPEYKSKVAKFILKNNTFLTRKNLEDLNLIFQEFDESFDPEAVFVLATKLFKTDRIPGEMLLSVLEGFTEESFNNFIDLYSKKDNPTTIDFEKLLNFLQKIRSLDRRKYQTFMADNEILTINNLGKFLIDLKENK
ncbi:hypothetical protein DLEV_153 [Diachasmimorpha longicaudata entomopoxvirus]|uniref:Uncharacterized protein n=1 Tax=Diachasmimorpha longicaudata entomopoxvirus TaxID=109981 RepID=A0A7R5WMP0_9POXV|nr:hypothetical protein QKK69_gp153 [Diachasmimorpha longicaudata entomopoxvirus]AKS26444.1 hypothetical protein DLEV_153 [Diachasmimorpha longicaudata entomopoxvirus]